VTSSDLLVDTFGRIPELVHDAIDGLTSDQLTIRLDADANSIAWLVWHLSRIADDHIAEVAGHPQVWMSGGWARRWRLPFDLDDTGYGHTAAQVAAVNGNRDLLRGYFDAVHEMAIRFVRRVTDSDLDRIVDERWNPRVTLGVRLVSVAGHSFEQAGQAAFIRGILERRVPGAC
jgi:hypothetical protein